MKFISDLHFHSKFSRATSKKADLDSFNLWAKRKGIKVIGTTDFTHPQWFKNLKQRLEPAEPGLYTLNEPKVNKDYINLDQEPTRFLLSTEISCIYSKNNKTRKIHVLIFAPDFETVEKINTQLGWIGNLKADGRPILGMEAKELAKIALDASEDCLVVSAHAWTPWFSLFGSKSGFDSIEECFEDYSKHIHAIETGLSSDPAMNWRLSALDNITLISNSDAHCVHPNTEVFSSSKKPTPIKDLNPSKALSIDFNGDLKQSDSKVSQLHKLPSPTFLYKVVTRIEDITTTPEHRFFVLENGEITERRAADLKQGDLVARLRRVSNRGNSHQLPSFEVDHRVEVSADGIKQLREAREKNEKTQKEIEEAAETTEEYVYRFENNKIKLPYESFINKFCECVGIDKDKFREEFVKYRKPKEKFPTTTTEDFCQILGYVLGDGGIGRNKGEIRNLALNDKDLELITHYNELIKEVFNMEGKIKKTKGNANEFRYPACLAKYFQKLEPKILAYSPQRKTPEFVFNLPKKELASFLTGLFDAEGSNGHHSVEFTSSSLCLAKEVQNLLLKFGIETNIYHDFEKNKKKWRYKLSIYGQDQLETFVEEIGFESVPKRKKVTDYLSSISVPKSSSCRDFLPLKSLILTAKDKIGVSTYDISSGLYSHLRYGDTMRRGNVEEFVEIFSKYEPEQLDVLDEIKKFVKSDIIWEPVEKVEKVKSDCKYVYDLTVPNYENYVANGFITHNSPKKLGREANVFEGKKLSYKAIIEAIKQGSKADEDSSLKLIKTIEFYPQEGKYHYDGHRKCEVRMSPQESKKSGNICPVCGKPLTIGVLNRVEELADREPGFKPENAIPFKSLIPLEEIIAQSLGQGTGTKGVLKEYKNLIQNFNSEFEVLLNTLQPDLEALSGPEIAEGIIRVRNEEVEIVPGYDGTYGQIKIFSKGEQKEISGQKSLF